MAEYSHIDLRRSRIIGLAAALAVDGLLLVLSLAGRLFGLEEERYSADAGLAQALGLLVRFPLPPSLTLPRIIWSASVFLAVGLVVYGLVTGLRRSLPARDGGAVVFLFGWCCTALALSLGGYLALCAERVMWPGLEHDHMVIAFLLPRSGLWSLLFGWVGGLAATIAYQVTVPAHAPLRAPDTPRAFGGAGLAAAAFVLALVVGGSIGRENTLTLYDVLMALEFPDPVSLRFTGASVGVLLLLAVAGGVALWLVLALGMRRIGSMGGAFVLGWGCAVLVAGMVGVLRHLAFAVTSLVSGERAGFFPWSQLGDGTAFGLLTGWLVGAVALAAFFFMRRASRSMAQ